MALSQLDINKLSNLISSHVDQVTCIECCKYYMAPKTALCGHTLCHVCWLGRKNCATCGAAVNRKSLKLNLILQKITEHTQSLRDECERVFKVKLDEFSIDTPIGKESNKDASKNVRDWLANSENQFSGPEPSQPGIQEFNNQPREVGSKVQVHSNSSIAHSTKNTVYVKIPQDDWDKIEELPDTEEVHVKNKENAIGPMDIEPIEVDRFEFTTDNPRRSSRKRDSKGDALLNTDQNSTKNLMNCIESKVLKNKQNWANVKRMKKEFSKLNKKSKNKLNVSIEMCKKTLNPTNKNVPVTTVNNLEDLLLHIDENTPRKDTSEENLPLIVNMVKDKSPNDNLLKNVDESEAQKYIECNTQLNQNTKQKTDNTNILSDNFSNIHSTKTNPVSFIMKGALQAHAIQENDNCFDDKNQQCITVNTDNLTKNSEDIEITIKIGNTLTNICIKKKEKDVQLKINTDREIQTSLEKCIVNNSPVMEVDPENKPVQNNGMDKTCQQVHKCLTSNRVISTIKTLSSKKNTESAETATALYEITESIEKELSKEMEKDATQIPTKLNKKGNTNKQTTKDIADEDDCLNDLDLFENDSVKEGNIQTLKSHHAPSEILISSLKSNRNKKQIDKRIRDTISDDLPISKKMKISQKGQGRQEIDNQSVNLSKTTGTQHLDQDSEIINYDFLMGQVFANIDNDLAKKMDEENAKNSQFVKPQNDNIATQLNAKATSNLCDSVHGQSENVFSLLEKDNDIVGKLHSENTQARFVNQEAPAKTIDDAEFINQELSTPLQDINDHSDESIVEETPQKNTSFHKVKQRSGETLNAENTGKNKSLRLKRNESVNAQNKSLNTPNPMCVINLSDITDDTSKSKQITILECPKSRPTLETPLTITNFVDQIKHKSTPMAKKSLNFDKENTEISDVDPDQTLYPNSFLVAKTTQEKEFMCKAFEDSPLTRARSPLTMRKKVALKFCLAGSCLTPSEISNVKLLCSVRRWDYVDKYTKDLTHLVVGVDEENKSQRSVKYMCALAASKWIVSYEWVQKCLQMKTVVDEEAYEALDNTGEPGPRRSRVAKQKLFQGITFFCMPPFSVLDVNTLKEMLEAAGGRVVNEAKAVRVTSDSVALLLAEPEHTQEDRFIYLAMELSIVPVNSEWVLNCLGSYTISSVLELLLCPETLLPAAAAKWPSELMAKEYE